MIVSPGKTATLTRCFNGYDAFDCDLAFATFWAIEYRYAVRTIPTKKNTPAIIMSPRSKARYAMKIQNMKRTTVTAIGMTNSLCSANKRAKSGEIMAYQAFDDHPKRALLPQVAQSVTVQCLLTPWQSSAMLTVPSVARRREYSRQERHACLKYSVSL